MAFYEKSQSCLNKTRTWAGLVTQRPYPRRINPKSGELHRGHPGTINPRSATILSNGDFSSQIPRRIGSDRRILKEPPRRDGAEYFILIVISRLPHRRNGVVSIWNQDKTI